MFKQLAYFLLKDLKYDPESVEEYIIGGIIILALKIFDR
jgi:hypothetical protein